MSESKMADTKTADNRKYRIRAAAFLGLIGGISATFAFSRTLMNAKKGEAKLVEKGGRQTMILLDEGSTLAMRALGWGTLYAVLGTGAICFGVWKLSGAKNFEEFRYQMGKGLPRITKDTPPTSPTDFDGLTDMMKYLASCSKE